MKIVDVAEFYAERGGGVRTYIDQKLAAAARAEHEVVVIAPGPEEKEEQREGGRIVWIKSWPLPVDPRYYMLLDERAVHAALNRELPDVVEGSSPWTGGWMVARWPGRATKSLIFHQDPVAVYPQTLLGRRFGYARVDALFKPFWTYLARLSAHYDLTVTSGQWLADRLASFGVQAPVAVPFGIDKSAFSPSLADPEVKASWLVRCGAPPEAQLLVAVSRHHPEKRLLTLLSAFERARQEQPLALVLFGDGPLRKLVERRARTIPGVHVAGFSRDRPHLAATLASADALLHGSAAETFGLVVAEAVCSGTPVIVPNRGGACELARPSFAELYEPGDAVGCAEAIARLTARDRSVLRAACLEQGCQHIFDVPSHFEALFRTYASRSLTSPESARALS
ncbi:MAG: glycosyltransferase [Myxococcales bacterium]|nr:glycosyltransferase [Myxococcales bacterium]